MLVVLLVSSELSDDVEAEEKQFYGSCAYGFCEQLCKEVAVDIMSCYCRRGYILRSDGRRCIENQDDTIYSGDDESGTSGEETSNCDDEQGICNKEKVISGDGDYSSFFHLSASTLPSTSSSKSPSASPVTLPLVSSLSLITPSPLSSTLLYATISSPSSKQGSQLLSASTASEKMDMLSTSTNDIIDETSSIYLDASTSTQLDAVVSTTNKTSSLLSSVSASISTESIAKTFKNSQTNTKIKAEASSKVFSTYRSTSSFSVISPSFSSSINYPMATYTATDKILKSTLGVRTTVRMSSNVQNVDKSSSAIVLPSSNVISEITKVDTTSSTVAIAALMPSQNIASITTPLVQTDSSSSKIWSSSEFFTVHQERQETYVYASTNTIVKTTKLLTSRDFKVFNTASLYAKEKIFSSVSFPAELLSTEYDNKMSFTNTPLGESVNIYTTQINTTPTSSMLTEGKSSKRKKEATNNAMFTHTKILKPPMLKLNTKDATQSFGKLFVSRSTKTYSKTSSLHELNEGMNEEKSNTRRTLIKHISISKSQDTQSTVFFEDEKIVTVRKQNGGQLVAISHILFLLVLARVGFITIINIT